MAAAGVMPTVGELVDSLDIQLDRHQFVKEALSKLGYSASDEVGEAFNALNETQLQGVRVNDAELRVREVNAILIRRKAIPGEWERVHDQKCLSCVHMACECATHT